MSTKIEWTDETWSPIRGCSRVSAGCVNCYAESVAHRFSGPGQPYEGLTVLGSQGPRWNGKVALVEKHLTDPLRWQKPRRIFVNSMSDLFHENVPDEWIDRIFAVMASAPHHTFQVLTKRPLRMRDYLRHPDVAERVGYAAAEICMARPPVTVRDPDNPSVTGKVRMFEMKHQGDCDGRLELSRSAWQSPRMEWWPLHNVWLGVSIEDQATADERIPLLLQTPPAVRFISYEPALGPVDLRCLQYDGLVEIDSLTGDHGVYRPLQGRSGSRLDWVICGGESSHGARPMHPDWARSMRDQCASAGVPFFFKQWGEWMPFTPVAGGDLGGDIRAGRVRLVHPMEQHDPRSCYMKRTGKKSAGRILNGRTWDEMPKGVAL